MGRARATVMFLLRVIGVAHVSSGRRIMALVCILLFSLGVVTDRSPIAQQVNTYTSTWRAALSNGSSFVAPSNWITNFGAPGAMLTGDFNGDGKTDIAAIGDPCARERARLQALGADLRALEGPGGPPEIKARLIERWHERHDGEVNQLTTRLASPQCPISAVRVGVSTGHSFDASGGVWVANFGGPGIMLTGDFDGDGKTDIAGWNADAAAWHVALSTGHSFDPSAGFWIRGFGAPGFMLTGDFNGDGKTDIAAWDFDAAAWRVALSTGHSFDPSTGFWIRGFGAPGFMLTGDFDGDGKTDIAAWDADAAAWHVALSTGHSFEPSAGFWIKGFGAPGIMLTGDFNGDGKTDIAGWNDPAAAWHVALSTGHSFDPSSGFWITNFGAPGAVLTGDFNGDEPRHKTDLAAYNYSLATQPLLTTTYNNPPYDTSRPTWASDVCGGNTGPDLNFPPYEWMQVLNPRAETDDDIVGISGVAVIPKLSDNDLFFTHPFGFDWEFFIAPDQAYRALLGPNNLGADNEYKAAESHAQSLGIWVPKGVLGVETDQDLVPFDYRAVEGDRVAVFGRWISDCGHKPFHTEIHPPLLLVTARPGSFPETESTSVTVISLPWLVGQRFEVDDLPFAPHMLNEVIKTQTPLGSTRVEAHPHILKPFSGVHLVNFAVRPPTPRRSPNDRLMVSYHFTVRHGVATQVYKAGPDEVGVLISMNDNTYTMASLPHKNDWDIPVADLGKYSDIIKWVQIGDAAGLDFLNPAGLLSSWFVGRDFLADRYDTPVASSTHDPEITRMAVDDLGGNTPLSEDATQPFPVYGHLFVEWERHP
jgi:FG-GAP-like repeat